MVDQEWIEPPTQNRNVNSIEIRNMSWDLCHVEREISETQKRKSTEIHNMFQGLAREDSEDDRDSVPSMTESEEGGEDLYL
eukprot:3644219-Karenia_brevis.AAC.1